MAMFDFPLGYVVVETLGLPSGSPRSSSAQLLLRKTVQPRLRMFHNNKPSLHMARKNINNLLLPMSCL